MSDWQPTEKQIEAACKGHARGMMPGVELDFDKMEDEVRDTKLWDAMKSALIAAHAAAEPVDTTDRALADVSAERRRQNETWGVQRHGWGDWIAILGEEFGEASREAVDITFGRCDDVAALRNELIHLAAVAVQIVEHIDSEREART